MTVSLYNRYRPKLFADLIGQEATTAALRSGVEHGRVPAASIFAGPRGTGKTTTARILARAVNCEAPVKGEPCLKCESCTTLSLDVVEIDAASERGIDNIRKLREDAMFAPGGEGKRIFILDEAHQITNDAFGALLKILEEPPAHVMFILATTDPGAIPETIVSRCHTYNFRRIATSVLVPYLARVAVAENITATTDALELIARASDGGARDALVALEDAAGRGNGHLQMAQIHEMLGTFGREVLEPLLDAYKNGDQAAVFTLLESLYAKGGDGQQVLVELLALVQEHFLHSVVKNQPGADLWYKLTDELVRSEALVVNASLSFLPLQLAFHRALNVTGAPPPPAPVGGGAARPATAAAAPVSTKTAPANPASVSTASTSAAPVAAPSMPAATSASQELTLEQVRLLWPTMLELLKSAKQTELVQMCSKQVFPEKVKDRVIALGSDSRFAHTWLQDRPRQELIRKALSKVVGGEVRVMIGSAPASKSAVAPTPAPGIKATSKSPSATAVSSHDRFAQQISRFFTATEA